MTMRMNYLLQGFGWSVCITRSPDEPRELRFERLSPRDYELRTGRFTIVLSRERHNALRQGSIGGDVTGRG